MSKPLPSQAQLLFPLLDVMSNIGPCQPRDLYDPVADKVGVDQNARNSTTMIADQKVTLWDRHLRWTQQRAKLLGFIERNEDKLWSLTEIGKKSLRNIRPGAVVTVYESADGVVLWAKAEAAVHQIDDGILQAIITSPPYPLIKKKEYAGQRDAKEHVAWLASFFAVARHKLVPDGSLFLNLGPVWNPGEPTMSLYSERLLIKLCDDLGLKLNQRLYFHNPSKLPAPAEWVTVRRVRLTPSIEEVYWLSRSACPKADNRRVLRPYSQRMRQLMAQGGEAGRLRPSGHALTAGAFAADNGGSIAHSLITAPNTASNDQYQRYCRENGLPAHPARFPDELVRFLIEFATDPGDIVYDPLAGSLTTAAVAQRLGRRWIASEKSLDYIRGGLGGRLAA